MTPVKCFYLEDAGRINRYLRRYHDGPCPAPWTAFGGMTFLDCVPHAPGTYIQLEDKPIDLVPKTDPRWPKVCECGREFTLEDHWQIFVDSVYVRQDTGEEVSTRNAPPGAIWNAWWYSECFKGADGRSLVVVCPDGHEWLIDSRASNCTAPTDNDHRCWIRHGEPPNLTVDKVAGTPDASAKTTCSAGGGSIQTPKWHGFLRNGFLVE